MSNLVGRIGMRLMVYGFMAVGLYGLQLNYEAAHERALDAVTRLVFWEALNAKEPLLSAQLVAHSVTLRAEANRSYWGGKDYEGVVFARAKKPNGKTVCQYHWTCIDWMRNAKPGTSKTWQLARRIAEDELAGRFVPPPGFDHAVSYDNPGPSERKNLCFARTALIPLGFAEKGSHHEFYREPADLNDFAARRTRGEVSECSKHKA